LQRLKEEVLGGFFPFWGAKCEKILACGFKRVLVACRFRINAKLLIKQCLPESIKVRTAMALLSVMQ
jgi:hypothetical protein